MPNLGPPPGYPDTLRGQRPERFYVHNWRGIDRTTPRSSIDDNRSYWLENLMPVGDGNLRAMFGEGATIFTTAKTIIYVYFFNIGSVGHAIVFFSDGTASDVNLNSLAVTTVSAVANTFFAGGSNPAAAQWNASGIVITSESSTNGYWSWDGTTLTTQPSNGPTWLTNGAVTTMPTGVHGSLIEIYQNRVWIGTPPSGSVTGARITVSAPSNGADFLTADGSNVTPQQDASLRTFFLALRQANGYLYALGDSNISVISNVQTAGSPLVTTYSNQNLDPQVGCSWTNTCVQMGQLVVFANFQGVYALAGGVATKISYQLDRIFEKADFSVTPSAAVAVIFGVKVYMLLIKSLDQTNTARNFLCMWNGQEWWIASQVNTSLSQVYTQELSGLMTAWGSDSTHLFALFQTANSSLQKILQSKLWPAGQNNEDFIVFKKTYRFYGQFRDYAGTGVSTTGTIDSDSASTNFSIAVSAASFAFVNSSGGVITFVNNTNGAIVWTVAGVGEIVLGTDVACYGLALGCTVTVTGADFAWEHYALLYASDQTFLG